jgi:hypothetical protein
MKPLGSPGTFGPLLNDCEASPRRISDGFSE